MNRTTGLSNYLTTSQLRRTNYEDRTKYWFFIHCLATGCTSANAGKEIPLADLSQSEKLRRIEAVLLISREALSSRKLAKLAGLADATEARTLIRRLNQHLEQEGRAYRIEEVAGGMTMLTRPQFAPWLRRLAHVPNVTKLSQSAMETLAVVAYRQPVLRADIESIRGVGCSEVLKQLMEGELVRICGRSEELGRPYLYGTTKRFLQIFGLRSADRLPRADWVNGSMLTSQPTEPILNSSYDDPGTSSEAKESTVKMSFSATTLVEDRPTDELQDDLLKTSVVRAVDDDDDDFDDDDDVDDDDDDIDDDDFEDEDDEEFDDEEESLDDADEDVEDDEELDDEAEEEDSDWEEVDDEDDDDWDDDDDEDDDDWEEDDDEEEWD
jgi:segregation and condensation protein B